MKPYYHIAQVSKQSHHQYMNRAASQLDRSAYYIGLIHQARQLHPAIGLAKIWHLFKPEGIGREAFEQFGKIAGYTLEIKPKTTSKGITIVYDNLLADKIFTGADQVWVTDITYFLIGRTFYYISMIMDVYLRKIIACDVADSLHAVHSIKLLRKAIKSRRIKSQDQLIHHSDKGSQYTSLEYIKLLKDNNIHISMCCSVFENTHMERLNGIIKNDYLIHWQPKSFNQLRTKLKHAVKNYNNCPHGKLGMLSPNQYEEQLKNVPLNQRTKLKIFTLKKAAPKCNPLQISLFNC